jgi:serine/threonine protein kinase
MTNNSSDTNDFLPEGTILANGLYQIILVPNKITKKNGPLGQGGFGITYLANELGYIKTTGFGQEFVPHETARKVVIKELYYKDYCHRENSTMYVAVSKNDNNIEFRRLVKKQLEEGKILKNFHHPNIVTTKDIFEENGTAYMVMEYIDSLDVQDLLESKESLNQILSKKYIKQVLEAVNYIHTQPQKVLHLDISPSNILIQRKSDKEENTKNSNAILIDFGAALAYGENNKVKNRTSSIVTGFKKNYAPSEQINLDMLKDFDASFDTYAIGATFYHMVTGVMPEPSGNISSGHVQYIMPSVLNKEMTEFLSYWIFKAMNPRYPNRYKTAEKMLWDFEHENLYEPSIKLATNKLNTKDYKGALEIIEKLETDFFETASTTRIKKECTDGIIIDGNRTKFERHVKIAKEYYQNDRFEEAQIEFEFANEIIPNVPEVIQYIKLCKEHIDGNSIEALVIKTRENINALLFETARLHIEDIKIKDPANVNIAILTKELEDAIKAEEEAKLEAEELLQTVTTNYENEDYATAHKDWLIVPDRFKTEDSIKTYINLTEKNIADYNSLKAKIITLNKDLDKTLPANAPAIIKAFIDDSDKKNKQYIKELAKLKLPFPKLTIIVAQNEQKISGLRELLPPPTIPWKKYITYSAILIVLGIGGYIILISPPEETPTVVVTPLEKATTTEKGAVTDTIPDPVKPDTTKIPAEDSSIQAKVRAIVDQIQYYVKQKNFVKAIEFQRKAKIYDPTNGDAKISKLIKQGDEEAKLITKKWREGSAGCGEYETKEAFRKYKLATNETTSLTYKSLKNAQICDNE